MYRGCSKKSFTYACRQILAPTCPGGNSYCFPPNDCVPSPCPTAVACVAGTSVFCPLASVCVTSTGAACSTTTNRYTGVKAINGYTVIAALPVANIGAVGGRRVYQVPAGTVVQIQPGYVIGYKSTGGLIATRAVAAGEAPDQDAGAASPAVGGSVAIGAATTLRHLVRAVASRPSSIVFYHTFNNVGT